MTKDLCGKLILKADTNLLVGNIRNKFFNGFKQKRDSVMCLCSFNVAYFKCYIIPTTTPYIHTQTISLLSNKFV